MQLLVKQNKQRESRCSEDGVSLRSMPYPYRCMLAICSDLDQTPNWRVYREIMRLLNSKEETVMGPGLGLEVGNSIYFEMPPDQFAYWNVDDYGREMVRTLIRSGHIDCLHSYGDLVKSRGGVSRALDELTRRDCYLKVWVDHATAPTNFGPDIMRGHGDEIDHAAYHADLTTAYGIEYVCRGRVTSVIGQDRPASLGGIVRWDHLIHSGRTVLKEAAKRILARVGNAKYAMHGRNQTLRHAKLRDGQPVYEFMRCNPHWKGVEFCAEGRYIDNVLTSGVLRHFIEHGGASILYTHLGKIDNPEFPFEGRVVAAFRRLAEEFHAGNILVTTTRRLLDYRRALLEATYRCRQDNGCLCVDVSTRTNAQPIGKTSARDLSGLTFYVPSDKFVSIRIDGQRVRNVRRNPCDSTGQESISLPWPFLEFPDI
jgi:hypothetical protein